MKILVLCAHTESLFWFRMNMMQAFREAGYTVCAAGDLPAEDWSEKFAAQGITYRQIPVNRNGINPFADLKMLRAVETLLREERPDKIFAYQAKPIVYGAMAAKRCGIPAFYPLIAGLGSIFRGEGMKARVLRKVLSVQYKAACSYAPAVILQNPDDRDELVRLGVLKPEKARLIHGSGVDVKHFSVTPMPETPGMLFVGRLIKDKGVTEYLDACRIVKAACPKAHCMLVGPFDSNPSALQPEELKAYTADGTVEYFGEQADVRPFLEKASVYVLPSYHEGTPKSVLEAMACGRAIVTTDAPGCRETVHDGINGYLVPVRDAEAVAEKALALLQDPARCAAFGKASREMAEAVFDVDKVNADIMQIMDIQPEGVKQHVSV